MSSAGKRAWLVAPSLLLLAGCSGIQSSLDPAGDQASAIKTIWDAMLIVCGLMYALVLGFLALAIWRKRSEIGLAPATGHTAAERLLERSLVVIEVVCSTTPGRMLP